MKAQRVDKMVSHIRGILERNMITTKPEGWEDVETLSLNNLIREMIPEAIDIIADRAPVDLFHGVDIFEKNATVDAQGKPVLVDAVSLDEDASRIVEIHCDTWDHDLITLTPKDSPLYKEAKNKWVKTVGVKERPLAVPGMSATGIRLIELYPAGNHVTVYYVPKAAIFTDDDDVDTVNGVSTPYEQIGCDAMLYESACWYAAYLVAMAQNLQNQNGYLAEAMRRIGSPTQPPQVEE